MKMMTSTIDLMTNQPCDTAWGCGEPIIAWDWVFEEGMCEHHYAWVTELDGRYSPA